MLTPIQAITSALLTAVLVQFLTLKFSDYQQKELFKSEENVTRTKEIVPNITKIPIQDSRSEEPEEVNKLLDAIFVTHGVEDKPEEKQSKVEEVLEQIVIVTEQNEHFQPAENNKTVDIEPSVTHKVVLNLDSKSFNSIYTSDWLILAYTPWYPQSLQYFRHFTDHFMDTLTEANSSLNLATLDCQAHPRLAALLNARSYPSLHLVTSSARLREWPFPLAQLNQQTLRFLINSEWRHLPVYQLLQLDEKDNPNIYLNEIQIKIFNSIARIIVNLKGFFCFLLLFLCSSNMNLYFQNGL